MASGAGIASSANAQEHQWFQIEGMFQNENLGALLLGPGDVDGDGFGDFVAIARWLGVQHMELRSGANAALIWEVELNESPLADWATSGAATTGDLDGDSVPDLVLGSMVSYGEGPGFDPNAGRVRAYSSASGEKLWEVSGEEANLFFGVAVAGMDDVDGDGVEDVAAGAYSDEPDMATQGNLGSVRVLSGVNGVELFRLYGPSTASSGPGGPKLGGTLGRLGDLDGDGVDDLGIGPLTGATQTDDGMAKAPVWVVSGSSGAVITELELPEYVYTTRPAFADVGDLTGDGVPETAVGFLNSINPGTGSNGVVLLYEGGSWGVLAEWPADLPKEWFGGTLAIPGDVDGDGYTDVLAGTRWVGGSTNPPYGVVRLYSGRTYEELLEIQSDLPGGGVFPGFFGRALAPLGDVNGDGAPEFVTSSAWSVVGRGELGMVRAYSTQPLTFSTLTPWIDAGGGVQRLKLDLGAQHAGQPYLVLGSATGIAPALPLGGAVLPLVPDAYSTWLLTTWGGPLGSGLFGVLDAGGGAIAKLTVPPLTGPLADLVGRVLWHGAIAIGPQGEVAAATNAVALTLLP